MAGPDRATLGHCLGHRLVKLDIINRSRQGGRGLAHSLGLAQDIALTPDGIDTHSARASDFQLAAKLADEDVDDLRLGLIHAAIEMAQERCLAEDRPLAKRQELDNAEFLACQRQGFAIDKRQMAVEVNLEIADRHRGRTMAVGAANDGIQIGQKLKPVERLGQIPVGPSAKRGDLVVGAGISRYHKDRHRHVVLANQPGKTRAVPIGEVDVQKHGINGVVLKFGQSCFNIMRDGLVVARLFEGHAQNVCYDRIIFYDQNMHGFNSHNLRFNAADSVSGWL